MIPIKTEKITMSIMEMIPVLKRITKIIPGKMEEEVSEEEGKIEEMKVTLDKLEEVKEQIPLGDLKEEMEVTLDNLEEVTEKVKALD
jgi:hypothetical protein